MMMRKKETDAWIDIIQNVAVHDVDPAYILKYSIQLLSGDTIYCKNPQEVEQIVYNNPDIVSLGIILNGKKIKQDVDKEYANIMKMIGGNNASK